MATCHPNHSKGQPMTFVDQYGPWAVVTGAAAGVGLAFVEQLHARGLGVVMADVDPAVVEVADRADGATRSCVVDVSSEGWIEALDEACAGIEVGLAVANAGIAHIGWYLDLPAPRRRAIIDVNCWATAELASWALPPMVERGRGGFVATSSGSALAGTAGVALYSATKAFVTNLVEAVGWELRDSGVHVQAIIAPAMDTPGFVHAGADRSRMVIPPADPGDVISRALEALPLGGRWLADEGLELAAAVERRARVELISEATVAMYPQVFER
jgi:short-subunit dehydrogenase